jgi:glyoxylase-like metal-dependent hydrolase (beta-lactamase superfamily II)
MVTTAVRAVAPQVFQVPVRLASVFLLLDRRVTIVDAGPVGSTPRILSALRLLGRSPNEVEQIVVTHYHLDHMGGLAALQRLVPGRTGVHAIEAAYARGERPVPVPYRGAPLAARTGGLSRLLCPPARVDTLLRDGD